MCHGSVSNIRRPIKRRPIFRTSLWALASALACYSLARRGVHHTNSSSSCLRDTPSSSSLTPTSLSLVVWRFLCMPTSMMLPSARVRSGGQNSGCRLNQVLHAALRAGATAAVARPKTAAAAAAAATPPLPNDSRNGKQFKCVHCDRLFSTKGNMVRHVQATHTRVGVKMFPCETCGKSFKRKEDLVMHTRVHTGESELVAEIDTWR